MVIVMHGREQIVANEDVLHEELLKLVLVRVHDAELLESFETSCSASSACSFRELHRLHRLAELLLSSLSFIATT